MEAITRELLDQLFSYALGKCRRIPEAEDLVQDTVLAYLKALQDGKNIDKPENWLYSVLNRKYYDHLRRQYKLPTVYMDSGDDVFTALCEDEAETQLQAEAEEHLRQEIAHMSALYRELVVRHYFKGERLSHIADDMNIPLGTIKRRLSYARNELRIELEKGTNQMENYTENSYAPKKMFLRNSGRCGFNDEPMSLVPDDDLLAQNLLMLAYEQPVSIPELSRAIGVSAAYIEPIIKKLTEGELMNTTGNGKVYTDFVIYEPGEYLKYRKEQEEFADRYSAVVLPIFEKALLDLRKTDFSSERLERFFAIEVFVQAEWNAVTANLQPQHFPARPNGGQWIAFAESCYPDGYQAPAEAMGRHAYGYSGRRWERIEDFHGLKSATIMNYETSLYPHKKYDGFPFSSFAQLESDVLRLLCLIKLGASTADLSHEMLQYIPLLQRNGMIAFRDGSLEVLVPCLTMEQYRQYELILNRAVGSISDILTSPMAEFLKGKEKTLPPHLKGSPNIPEAKLYLPAAPNGTIFLFNAIDRGIIPLDLGYLCPETIVITE